MKTYLTLLYLWSVYLIGIGPKNVGDICGEIMMTYLQHLKLDIVQHTHTPHTRTHTLILYTVFTG